jgi:muramidase (phage lysozyme)
MRDNIENQPFGNFIWFMGVVEDIDDPLKINRVRVRCIGFHSDNRSEVATDDLPWAPMMNSTTNMSAPVLNQGDWVVGFFIDGAKAQQPVVLGSITGIPTQAPDPNKGFSDPDGIFPRSGQISNGTNSPLARGELGIPTGIPPAIVPQSAPSPSTTPAPAEATAAETPPAANPETNTKTYTPTKGAVATAIGKNESNNDYTKYNTGTLTKPMREYKRDFSKYTVRQHIANKNTRDNNPPPNGRVFAMGRYQIVPNTMEGIYKKAGLTLDSVLSPQNQDLLYNVLLPSAAKRYINKQSDDIDAAVIAIAKIWASVGVPYPIKGAHRMLQKDEGWYAGDGINKAHTTSEVMKEALRQERGGEIPIYEADYTEIVTDESGNVVEVSAPFAATPTRQNDEDAITYTRRTTVADVKTASGLSWNEPVSQYAALYPKNHVMETAGGHVLEFDDTEGSERINIFHKNGSFIEMHPDGRVVFRSRGSMNQVTYGDGNIYVRGNYNITSTGDVNILSNKSTNISTVGDVNWKVGGNFNLDVQGEAKLISGKMFLEGSELRINEGTAGIGAPEPSSAVEGAGSSEYAGDGEFIGENTLENAYGEQSAVTVQEETAPDGKPVAGGSVDTKLTDYGVNGSNIDYSKKISKYYTLYDLTNGTLFRGGGKAKCTIQSKRGYTVDQQIKNMSALAQVILDKLRDAGLKFSINQAYRNGVSKSDHVIGCAVDINPQGGLTAKQFAEKAYAVVGATSKQFLLEYNENSSGPGWVHIAYNPNGQKSELRVASVTTNGGSGFVRKVLGSNFVDLRRR